MAAGPAAWAPVLRASDVPGAGVLGGERDDVSVPYSAAGADPGAVAGGGCGVSAGCSGRALVWVAGAVFGVRVLGVECAGVGA